MQTFLFWGDARVELKKNKSSIKSANKDTHWRLSWQGIEGIDEGKDNQESSNPNPAQLLCETLLCYIFSLSLALVSDLMFKF